MLVSTTFQGIMLMLLGHFAEGLGQVSWTLSPALPTEAGSNGSNESLRSFLPPPCSLGYFECIINPSRCIPQALICNGRSDCGPGDESDESPAICKNIHEKDFWDSFYQKRPDADLERNGSCKYEFPVSRGRFSNSGVDYIEMVEQCTCFHEKLFCQNMQRPASDFISFIPEHVEFLDLSGSRIDTEVFRNRDFPNLETLILSSCYIQEIASGAFATLRSLRTLHLTGNHLHTLPDDGFAENVYLQKLFLGYNELERVLPDAFRGLSSLQELDLRNNKLTGKEVNVFRYLSGLSVLQLSSNLIQLHSDEYFIGLENLKILNLAKNKIEVLGNCLFVKLTSLRQLYLSWNTLKILDRESFCNLTSLVNLNLNGNEITKISPTAFRSLANLESLNLERNRFGELEEARLIFENLTRLQHIYFDEFWMCWWAPHVRNCEPKGDGISSVDNLLDNILLRTCVWIMGVLGVVGNGFVIASRLIFREKNRIHSFYIKNLALADLLMGLFLLSIAFHDVKFRGDFLAHQHSWRHSSICKISGMLCALSSEASVLILTLITLDRYYSIVQPFAERYSLCPIAIGIIGFLWVLSLAFSSLPFWDAVQGYFGSQFYTTNGLCLPLQIHNPYDPGWEYSFLVFVVLNSVAFTFISYAYWRMLRIIQSSSTTLRTNQQRQDGILAMRFGLVVVTDFACWAPVIFSRCLAMCGVSIPATFYGWLAIFVLPVNSALNPILYTLTTKLFKQRLSKLTVGFRKRFRRRRLEDSSGSLSFFHRTTQRTTVTSMGNSIMSFGKSGRRGTASSLSMGRRVSTQTNAPLPISMMQSGVAAATTMALKSVVNVATIHPVSGCFRDSRANSISLPNAEAEHKF